MKKKLFITTGLVVLVVALGIGIYHSDASQADPRLSVADIRQLVQDQYPGTIKDIELEKDFNRTVYDIEVVSDGHQYELELDGNSGEVLKLRAKGLAQKDQLVLDEQKEQAKDQTDKKPDKDKTEEDKTEPNKQDSNKKNENEQKTDHKHQSDKNNTQKKTVIDKETAINIAMQEFSGRVTDFELDEDDGRLIYEIEIESNRGEAEFEIDAYTGEIIVIDIDLDDDDD